MTAPTITDADREAVESFAKEPHVVFYLTNTKLEEDWRTALLQTFAAHRHAHTAPLKARVQELEEALESASHENTAAWAIAERLEQAVRDAREYISRPMRYSFEDFDIGQRLDTALSARKALEGRGS